VASSIESANGVALTHQDAGMQFCNASTRSDNDGTISYWSHSND